MLYRFFLWCVLNCLLDFVAYLIDWKDHKYEVYDVGEQRVLMPKPLYDQNCKPL